MARVRHVDVVADGALALVWPADGREETVVDALATAVLARAPLVGHQQHVLEAAQVCSKQSTFTCMYLHVGVNMQGVIQFSSLNHFVGTVQSRRNI